MTSVKGSRKSVSIGNMILLACYIVLTVSGLVFFKLGSQKDLSIGIGNGTLHMNINLMVILGMALYICSFLLYLFLVSQFDLSYILPISTGLVAILTILAAWLIFHETITVIKIAGIALVILGTIFINLKK